MREDRGPNPPATENEPGAIVYVLDLVSSAGAVVLVGTLLFAISGLFPPLVAIESGSMEPHIDTGDLVFVMDEDRFSGAGSYGDTGVVPAERGEATGYTSFQASGDVIVFYPNGDESATPVIHRAMFWVNESENWYQKADSAYTGGADSCEELVSCRPDHAGFITKGDNNGGYDQASALASCDGTCEPVKPEWIVGTAESRVPFLGNVRLQIQRALA